MYGFFTKKLTEYSNHIVDWTNIAVLFKTGKHRYTTNELLIRGGMVVTTALCAFLGAYYNNEEKTKISNTTASIALGFLGFTISHLIVLLPLMNKRYTISKECQKIALGIEARLEELRDSSNEFSNLEKLVKAVIIRIQTSTKEKATQTWGHRQSLLSQLQDNLNKDYPDILKFCTGDVDSIINKLNNLDAKSLSLTPARR